MLKDLVDEFMKISTSKSVARLLHRGLLNPGCGELLPYVRALSMSEGRMERAIRLMVRRIGSRNEAGLSITWLQMGELSFLRRGRTQSQRWGEELPLAAPPHPAVRVISAQ